MKVYLYTRGGDYKENVTNDINLKFFLFEKIKYDEDNNPIIPELGENKKLIKYNNKVIGIANYDTNARLEYNTLQLGISYGDLSKNVITPQISYYNKNKGVDGVDSSNVNLNTFITYQKLRINEVDKIHKIKIFDESYTLYTRKNSEYTYNDVLIDKNVCIGDTLNVDNTVEFEEYGSNMYMDSDEAEWCILREVVDENGEVKIVEKENNKLKVEKEDVNPEDSTIELQVKLYGATATVKVKVMKKELTRIAVTTKPDKTSYIEGQSFNLKGMQITAYYNNNTNKLIYGYSILDTDINNLTVGKTSITIRYTEDGITKKTTQAITVAEKELTRIEVTNSPTKTSYIEGQNFNKKGMKITAHYNNETSEEISEYTITDGENLSTGKTSITISYTKGEITKTTTQEITVSAKKLTGIVVTNTPAKTSYVEGQNFDDTGMVITASYNNGTSEEISGYTITNGTNLSTEQTSITISYTEGEVTKETEQAITVEEKKLTRIEVTNKPDKTVYKEGQDVDIKGMIITAYYNDETNKTTTGYSVTNGTNLKKEQTSITIKYKEGGITKQTTQAITVLEKELTGIAVTNSPTKTSYIEGQSFNKKGMVITASYDDGTSGEVIGYSLLNIDNLEAGQTSITISYTEGEVTKTTTQEITVSAKKLTGIAVTNGPTKTSYVEGQDFDATGMKITASYNNGTSKAVTGYTITNGTNLSTEQTSIIISYTEREVTKETEQAITVVEKELTGIAVTHKPDKTSYIEGQDVDIKGMIITAYYNDETNKTTTGYSVTNGTNLKKEQTSITIRYTEGGITKKIEQEITVAEKVLTGIEVTNGPTKTDYIEGQNFDETEMVVTASYNNGKSKAVTEYTIINGMNLKKEQTSITISYTEGEITKETTQEITVAEKVLTGIVVTHKPDKTSYIEGQNVDIKGMVITAYYNSGNRKTVTGYTVINGTNLKKNQTNITIRYTEGEVTKEVTQTIIVEEKVLTQIEIKENPTKMEYYVGEKLDLTGLVIMLTYNDEITEEITEGYTVDVTKLEEAGEKEVKITYLKEELILKVSVIEEKLIVDIKEMDEEKNEGITYLSTTTQNMTEEQLKSKFETNGDITIEAKGANGEIGTGSIIKISKNEETKEYTLVIIGDLTGDGILDDRDLLRLARYGAGLDKNLTEAYLKASNVVKDEALGDDRDLLKMARILVGLDSIINNAD